MVLICGKQCCFGYRRQKTGINNNIHLIRKSPFSRNERLRCKPCFYNKTPLNWSRNIRPERFSDPNLLQREGYRLGLYFKTPFKNEMGVFTGLQQEWSNFFTHVRAVVSLPSVFVPGDDLSTMKTRVDLNVIGSRQTKRLTTQT